MASARIAVLIPTVGESTLEDVIRRTREELPSTEIILISSIPVHELAERYATRFLEFSERTWKSIGINLAVTVTEKDWFVIVDADAIPQPGWGKGMLSAFSHGHAFFSGSVDLKIGRAHV